MRIVFFILFLQLGFHSFAQERCASVIYAEAEKSANPSAAKKMGEAEIFIQRTSSASRVIAPAIIRIPVVVHIVYNNASQNISDEQVKAQIESLTKDFRRKNADTANTPERFKSMASDIQIEFYLATTDTRGRATNGIVRKYSSVTNFLANDKIKFSAQGGDDAWDSKSFLNIWVGNFVAGNGYSSAPGSDAMKDGVVINVASFSGKGRIATHEVGHWLGLRHIWGDAACGDDLVSDTPPQSSFTQGCPSGFRSTCDNGSLGDMYMNYMDYTSDVCMNMFTEGQKRRMLSSFADGGARESLLDSKGLQTPWVESSPFDGTSQFAVYPNPAQSDVTIQLSTDHIGKAISIMNVNGVLVQTVQIRSASQKINLTQLKAGIYFVRLEGFTQKIIKL